MCTPVGPTDKYLFYLFFVVVFPPRRPGGSSPHEPSRSWAGGGVASMQAIGAPTKAQQQLGPGARAAQAGGKAGTH
eukprot:5597489-Heterocapsa_arctica.AAC.1